MKRFSNYIPINVNLSILNEKYVDLAIDEMLNHENFEKSETGIES